MEKLLKFQLITKPRYLKVQQGSQEWREVRKKAITASTAADWVAHTQENTRVYYKTFGLQEPIYNPNSSCAKYATIPNILQGSKINKDENIYMKKGRLHESEAADYFQKTYLRADEKLEVQGIYVNGWLAASPDRIWKSSLDGQETILEIKCPKRVERGTPPRLDQWIQLQILMFVLQIPRACFYQVQFRELTQLELEAAINSTYIIGGNKLGCYALNTNTEEKLCPRVQSTKFKDLYYSLVAEKLSSEWKIIGWEIVCDNKISVNFDPNWCERIIPKLYGCYKFGVLTYEESMEFHQKEELAQIISNTSENAVKCLDMEIEYDRPQIRISQPNNTDSTMLMETNNDQILVLDKKKNQKANYRFEDFEYLEEIPLAIELNKSSQAIFQKVIWTQEDLIQMFELNADRWSQQNTLFILYRGFIDHICRVNNYTRLDEFRAKWTFEMNTYPKPDWIKIIPRK